MAKIKWEDFLNMTMTEETSHVVVQKNISVSDMMKNIVSEFEYTNKKFEEDESNPWTGLYELNWEDAQEEMDEGSGETSYYFGHHHIGNDMDDLADWIQKNVEIPDVNVLNVLIQQYFKLTKEY